jgi:hypothetical protein
MTKYYHGSKVDVINDLAGEIENSVQEINDKIEFLAAVDWNEIFEHAPNSEKIQSEIEDAIDCIRGSIYDLTK